MKTNNELLNYWHNISNDINDIKDLNLLYQESQKNNYKFLSSLPISEIKNAISNNISFQLSGSKKY